MAIYFMSFFLSTCLFWLAEKVKIGRISKKIIVIFALFIPIALAGMRKIGIGTDTTVYTNVLFDAAKESGNFLEYLGRYVYSSFQNKRVASWEIGYNVLLYLSAKLTGSYQGVLFATHLLIIFLIYGGLKHSKGHYSSFFGMFSFYLLFYGNSLNAMRQWIAVSVLFYGFHYLQENQNKKYFLTIIIAILFHNSGAIGILLWFIYKFFRDWHSKHSLYVNEKKIDENIYKLLLFFIIGIIALAGLSTFGYVLGSINSIFARYVRLYISANVSIMPMQIIRRLPIAILLIINWKNINRSSKSVPFLYGMFIGDLLISQLGSITAQSGRIGFFFGVYEILLFSELVHSQKRGSRIIYGSVMTIYYCLSFYYDFVLMGRAEIVPYLFYFN